MSRYVLHQRVYVSILEAEKQVKQLLAVDLVEVLRPHQVTEDITVGPDEDPVQYLAVLIECLALLRRLMDSVDVS